MDADLPAPSPSPSQARGHSRPEADEPTSCRECKRRKAKCDGTKPECIVCQKYRRHCLYDKHSKTRLTRKYAAPWQRVLAPGLCDRWLTLPTGPSLYWRNALKGPKRCSEVTLPKLSWRR